MTSKNIKGQIMTLRSELKYNTVGNTTIRYKGHTASIGKMIYTFGIYYDNDADTIKIKDTLVNHRILPSPKNDLTEGKYCIKFRLEERGEII